MRKRIIVALFAVGALAGCNGGSARSTPTAKPPTATPAPLFTLTEAEDRVQQYAATDANLPAKTGGAYFACGGAENRYSAERQTWVIHCKWERIEVAEILTAKAVGKTPPPVTDVYEKTYLLDDVTGNVRE